jgi:hypothetical protein
MFLTDLRATTSSVRKVAYWHFLHTEKKPHTVWRIFLHPNAQDAPKQVIKIILRQLTNVLVPSLTLQISDIFLISLESPALEFFAFHLPYLRSRCFVTWQREVKLCMVSDGTSFVVKCLSDFLKSSFGSRCVWG